MNKIAYISACILMMVASMEQAIAQNMGSGNFNSCGPGTHYDSGGAGGNYASNELFTETYCSNVGGDCIQFTFTSFNTEACCDDLTIYDGPNTGSPLIGTYAGTALPNGGTITSTSGCLTFVFDSDFSITRPGWVANYTCVPCPVPTCSDGIQNQGELGIDCGGPCPACPPIMGNGSWNDCGPGTHYDSGNAGGNYSSNELITETYCSDVAGDCIQFTFTTFNTEACCDDLTIYDGPNTGSPLIGTYAGTALPNGGTITSTSGCLTFVFDSDGSITRPGWEANFTCVPCPVPTCSDGIMNQGETGIDCGGPCPACPPVIQPAACANISQTLPTASTYKFYDDGGVGGDNCADQAGGGNYCNCNCFTITTICAPAGEFIVADFNEFAMWNTTSGWDWMRIYDNNTNAGTVLYDNSATGPDNPFGDCGQGATVMNFCSTNECLTFEFWATSVVNRAGWDCDVSSTTIACVLPVEFLSFTGESQGLTNALTWTTASEINNDYFIVEASSNNMESFNAIGVVDGAGNSNTEITYEFIDNNITSDITYYRLRQFDFDGESDISSIIAVRSTRETISFFPNPAQNELKLNVSNVSAGNYRIVYTNILGSVVEEQIVIEKGASIYQLDQFNNLTAGVYFVRVVAQDGTTIGVDKVVKE